MLVNDYHHWVEHNFRISDSDDLTSHSENKTSIKLDTENVHCTNVSMNETVIKDITVKPFTAATCQSAN